MNKFDKGQESSNIVGDLIFNLTCSACPEQYDVYQKHSASEYTQVGYVRLRWGSLRCDYPDCGGETILLEDISDEGHGMFDNEKSRAKWLKKIADTIWEKINE
mgnify:CR=1 FL=1